MESPPPAVFHNKYKQNTAGLSATNQPDDNRGNGDVLVVTKVSKLMLPGLKISHDIFDIFIFQML